MRSLFDSPLKLMIAASAFAAIIAIACTSSEAQNKKTETSTKTVAQKQLIDRGKYLVNTVGGCPDCHSPKKFGPNGPEFDESRHLSGHPANDPLPPLKGTDPFTPGNWIIFAPDLTTFVGPWGLTFAANLTPHPTGIGTWKEENFINALRKGKHMGIDEGRPIMPPMPWQNIGQMTDEDLKAVFAYLKSIPPIDNMVPAPLTPQEAKEILK